MDLYLDRLPEQDHEFHKLAAYAARLSEQAENWPQELTSELYKQLPFLSDYDVNVNLDRVDPSRGFAFGYADVATKTERPEVEHEESGIPHIRVPLVVIERSVKPFSVFLDGGEKVMPLTEDRVRQMLFNPATFDLSTAQPHDPSLVEPLMPPQRSGMGAGGEVKMASAEDALMAKLSGKNKKDDWEWRKTPPWDKSNIGERAIMGAGGIAGLAGAGADLAHLAQGRSMSGWKRAYPAAPAVGALAAEGIHRARGKGSLFVKKKGEIEKKGSMHPGLAAGIAGGAGLAVGGLAGHHVGQKKGVKQGFYGGIKHGVEVGKIVSSPEHQKWRGSAKMGETYSTKTPSGRSVTFHQTQDPSKMKKASILLAIAPTIRERDVERFVEKVASSPTLQAGFQRSGVSPLLVEAFDKTKRASADQRLALIAESIEPSCVTFQRLPGGQFLVKSASVDAFADGPAAQGQVVPEAEVADAVGPENAQQMQPGQAVTAVSDPVDLATESESRAKPIDEFGQYKVQDTMGNSLVGHVFPKMLMWDGDFTPQPMALFTNGSAYAMHDTVAGEFVGKGTNLSSDVPRGDGVFYTVQGGEAVCTAPLTIGSSAAGPDGLAKYIGTDPFGTQVQVSLQDGIKTPMRITDSEYVLPSSWKFMRLNNQTQVITDPTQMNKMASVRNERNSVTLFYNCGYHFQGGCGLDKISSDHRYNLDALGAEFMLGVLGVDGVTAKTKVAEARKRGHVKLAGLKSITLLSERYGQAEKTASALMRTIPNLARDLVKEAASLPDAGSVDSVLALNFINPENVLTFVSYIPQLEDTSEKLAEMLLHGYLGMQEIPEGAVERSMRNLEEVVTGLKALEHSMSAEEGAAQ